MIRREDASDYVRYSPESSKCKPLSLSQGHCVPELIEKPINDHQPWLARGYLVFGDWIRNVWRPLDA